MNCPYCKHTNAYVGLNVVECGNSACMHFNASMAPIERRNIKAQTRRPAKWASFIPNSKWSSGYHPPFDGRFRRRVKRPKKIDHAEFSKTFRDIRSRIIDKQIAESLKEKKTTKLDSNPMADHGDFYFGD